MYAIDMLIATPYGDGSLRLVGELGVASLMLGWYGIEATSRPKPENPGRAAPLALSFLSRRRRSLFYEAASPSCVAWHHFMSEASVIGARESKIALALHAAARASS